MKKTPSRKEIQNALGPAFVKAIESLDMVEDGTTCCRTMRALLHLAFDVGEAGDAPAAVVAAEIHRVARKRFPRLKPGTPVLLMKEGQA